MTRGLEFCSEHGSELHNKLGDHLVLNANRVTREIQHYLGTDQRPTPGVTEVMAVSSGKGQQNGDVKGELTVKFTGQCFCVRQDGPSKVQRLVE